jgi:16S rRNA processing protein RimM
VPRASLPETGEEEFYLADLIGLEAVTGTGEPFGRIINVLNFGGGDILELARASPGATLLLPFKKDIFPYVDLKAGRVTILPPVEIEGELSRPES